MKFASLYVALLAAGLCATANAAQIQGQITDESGAPIAAAVVSIDGGKQTHTDHMGRYQLTVNDNSHLHLHVSAKQYVHAQQELMVTTGTLTQNITLAATPVENITVTASALGRSALESTSPVTVLGEDQLRLATQPSLGDTLEQQPGVQASHFTPAASRPIIRGMGGPRVKVLENGLSVGDASTVSADHAVTTEAASAQQIEILRGPGTLLYGNGAIGGVVNVVDQRAIEEPIDSFTGDLGARYDTANDGRTVSTNLNAGNGTFNWHIDGTRRRTHSEDIPGHAIKGVEGHTGKLDNSQLELDDFAGGVGYTDDRAYVSVSGTRTESNYGIPSRGEDDAPDITIDLQKTNWQLHSGLLDPLPGFTKVKFDGAYTHYEHAEEENGDADTFFTNKESEGRLTLNNAPWGEWQGVIGLHAIHRDFSIKGEEALTPDTITDTTAIFIVQERRVGDFRFELGGRLEHYRLKADDMDLETLNGDQLYSPGTTTENNLSLSAGMVWDFSPSYNLSVSLNRAERSATAEELYSYGPHDATQSFEVGSQYTINNGQITPKDGDSDKEVANNIDITLRKLEGLWTGSFSASYNRVDDYFYEQDTGLIADDIANAGEEGDIPVYQYTQGDIELYSFEGQANVPFADYWSLSVFSDYTRGRLRDGGDLPRISPLRVGSTLNFDYQQWHADVGSVTYAKQDKTAENETETSGYTLMNASVNYRIYTANGDLFVYLKGTNLTDREARPHTSLLKDYAPLMGRNFTLGMRYDF